MAPLEHNGRKSEHLQPLYESYAPVLKREAHKWRGIEMIPSSAIQAEIDKHFVNAVKTFNPQKAQLSTWVTQNLKKASRFVKTYQNLGKIPRDRSPRFARSSRRRSTSMTSWVTSPTPRRWPTILDGRPSSPAASREMRRDLPASGFESVGKGGDPTELLTPKELEAIKLMQYDLTPEERTVYEYTFGMNGKPRYQPGQIAKTTNIHPSKVSRIRNKLVDKLKEAMDLV